MRPVTLVLGRNNSGKSALVRAPLVLATGFRTDSPAPLDLDLLGEEIFDSFTDLICGGRPHGSIRIELCRSVLKVFSPQKSTGYPLIANLIFQ